MSTPSNERFEEFRFWGGDIPALLADEDRRFAHMHLSLLGTVRACAPEDTLARVAPHLERLGITRIAHIGGLDVLGLPVSVAYRPNSRHLSSGQGKGLSEALADTSALMECVEGYHAECGASVSARGTYKELRSRSSMVDPTALSAGFFQAGDLRGRTLDWTESVNILDSETVLVPTCLTRLDFSSAIPETNILAISSNGLASGNLLTEAICHALLEVVERHCLVQFSRLTAIERNARRLDLATVASAPVKDVLRRFQRRGVEVVVWDMTDELAIPSFNCAAVDRNPLSPLGLHGGTGTHFDREIALLRALAEAVQARAVWISGSRDDLYPERYAKNCQRKSGLAPADGGGASDSGKDFEGIQSGPAHCSFKESLDWLCARLKRNGYRQVLVVNRTQAEFNLPVVQVFVPGMQLRHDR